MKPSRVALSMFLAAGVAAVVGGHARAASADAAAGCSSEDGDALGALGPIVDGAASAAGVASSTTVNGNPLGWREHYWLDWTTAFVFPSLPADMSCQEKIDTTARVYWWTLKEGDLGAASPPAYSNCRDDGKKHAWNYVCPGMWQVGFGVQAWDHSMSEVRGAVARTYGSETAALQAAYDASGLDAQGVSWKRFLKANNGNARLRRSWLERAPAVGFVLEDPDVTGGCVEGAASWCFEPRNPDRRWPETEKFGATIQDARRSIADVRSILEAKQLCE